jgi:hypothetical protein
MRRVMSHEAHDVRGDESGEAPRPALAVLGEKSPQGGQMRNDGPRSIASLLAKVMPEVRDNLLISAQMRQTLRRNQRFLAQYGKEPVQCGSIAQKGMAIPHAERHIAIYDRLVDVSNDYASAGKPPTEIVDHPNVAPGTLLTMPFR